MICSNCGENKPASKFNKDSFSPTMCFRCRVSGVAFTNPVKSGQGADVWRHDTLKEFGRRTVEEGRKNGLDPVPRKAPGDAVGAGTLNKLKAHYGNS